MVHAGLASNRTKVRHYLRVNYDTSLDDEVLDHIIRTTRREIFQKPDLEETFKLLLHKPYAPWSKFHTKEGVIKAISYMSETMHESFVRNGDALVIDTTFNTNI